MCTHPRDTPVPPTPRPTPSPQTQYVSAERSCSWLCHQKTEPSLVPGLDSPDPLLQHTTVGAGLARETLTGWVFPELGDQPMGHTVPSDLAFQNLKLETTPSPPSGLSLPRCGQGTLSV